MQTGMNSESQKLATQLFSAAQNVAEREGLRLGDGADHQLRYMADEAALKLLGEVGGNLTSPRGRGLVSQAEDAFTKLAETMIEARPIVYDHVGLARDVIGEDTLQFALGKLCPLFPIC